MLHGSESQIKDNNHVNSHNNNNSSTNTTTTTQLSCTTTTLIKYRVKQFDNNETHDTAETAAARETETNKKTRMPKDGDHQNGVESESPYDCAAKSTTTTTFSVNSSQPRQPQQCSAAAAAKNMQQSSEGAVARPPFITTVTRGKFLPSKFDLLVEKSLFTFSSRPRPVQLIKKHCCSYSPSPAPTLCNKSSSSRYSTHGNSSTSRNESSLASQSQSRASATATPPRGAHDYYNVMWDPHVIRGTTAATTRISESNKEVKSTATAANESAAAALSKVKRSSTKPVTRSSRYKQQPFLSQSPPGRHLSTSTMIQTEKYLEELGVPENRVQIHQSIQTEPIFNAASFPSRSRSSSSKVEAQVQAKYGVDSSTQILPGELFYFDDEVQPVLESLIGKILEQAMYETVEEEEIATLREEKNRFHEQRRIEEKELRELQKEHERITAEKEKLRQRLEEERSSTSPASSSSRPGMGMGSDFFRKESTESFQRISTGGTTVFTTSYLLELLPSVLNSLRQEGFLNDNVVDEQEDSFSRTASDQRQDSPPPPPQEQQISKDEEEIADITSITNETQAEISYKNTKEDEAAGYSRDVQSQWQRSDSQTYEKELEDLSTSSPVSMSWSTEMDTPRRQESQSQLSRDTSTTTTTTVTTIVNQLSLPLDDDENEEQQQ